MGLWFSFFYDHSSAEGESDVVPAITEQEATVTMNTGDPSLPVAIERAVEQGVGMKNISFGWWPEICEIRQFFKGDSIKFCEVFYKNHFGAPPK